MSASLLFAGLAFTITTLKEQGIDKVQEQEDLEEDEQYIE